MMKRLAVSSILIDGGLDVRGGSWELLHLLSGALLLDYDTVEGTSAV